MSHGPADRDPTPTGAAPGERNRPVAGPPLRRHLFAELPGSAFLAVFGPVSGAHFNPVVSAVDAAFGGMRWRDAIAYAPAQIIGCIIGAVAANVVFSEAVVSISTKHRASGAHLFSEVIATAGTCRSTQPGAAGQWPVAFTGGAGFSASCPASRCMHTEVSLAR